MALPFDLAGGSVPGRDHRMAGRNNQDAFHYVSGPDRVAAVVCDGCGSGAKSEIGAEIGALALATELAADGDLRRSLVNVLETLALLLCNLQGNSRQLIGEYFLFTIVGAVIDAQTATFFSIGDGMVIVNGERIRLGPFPDNAPPYLGYELPLLSSDFPLLKHLVIRRVLATEQLTSFLLATDGIDDLIGAEGRTLAGRGGVVEPVESFWTDGIYFRNPDAIRRRLTVIGREHVSAAQDGKSVLRTPGVLRDDTTLIVGRRKE